MANGSATRPEPAWHQMAQSPLHGTTQPVGIEEEGQPQTENGLRPNL